jgi:hypothetical protein
VVEKCRLWLALIIYVYLCAKQATRRAFADYPRFNFRNYSVPQHDPLDAPDDREMAVRLVDQIRPSQVVIVLAGMWAAYREWIEFEIREARGMEKPIIGVRPWGQERVPQIVQDAANVIHGRNVAPILRSIRELA